MCSSSSSWRRVWPGDPLPTYDTSPGAIATFSMVELAIVDPRNGKAFCRIPRGKGSRWPRIGGVRGDLLLTTSPAGIFRVK